MEDDEDEGLIAPCRCKGSMAWVHQKCLKKWLVISKRPSLTDHFRCPNCRQDYMLVSTGRAAPDYESGGEDHPWDAGRWFPDFNALERIDEELSWTVRWRLIVSAMVCSAQIPLLVSSCATLEKYYNQGTRAAALGARILEIRPTGLQLLADEYLGEWKPDYPAVAHGVTVGWSDMYQTLQFYSFMSMLASQLIYLSAGFEWVDWHVAFPFAVRRKSLRMLVMLNPPVLRVLRNLLVNFVLVLTPFLPALHEPLSHFV
jgi:hypothetical protein